MPDLIRHPAARGAEGLDSCLRRNDGRLHSIVICSRDDPAGLTVDTTMLVDNAQGPLVLLVCGGRVADA